jgi:radical SAM family uncharacterized protein/radical SAM-linked protein
MSKLYERLEREVLPLVTKPSRYIGAERNVPKRKIGNVELEFLFAFPDVYEIGMSHLGIRVLYDILNRRQDTAAERCFAPWTDMEKLMREKGIPLFSLETHRPARDFDVIGFTLQYELHYTTILAMIDLAGIPLRSSDRVDGDPLILAGGPCTFNSEPMAAFVDLVAIGDGESGLLDLADLLISCRTDGVSRDETLVRAAGLPGIYVPSLYHAEYENGRYVATRPVNPAAPERVARRVERSLDGMSHPICPVVPITEAAHDRLTLEIMRGCTRGCRFCQAGMVTRPVRERPVNDLVALAEEGLACTGYDEISLMSLSTSDYSGLNELVGILNEKLFDRRVGIALPSLRADRFGLDLASAIGKVRRAGLTFAPEAGTERLRDVINKNESEESILETVHAAFSSGWNRIKLYFMIGLPTETEEDVRAIASLVQRVRSVARAANKGAKLNVSVSPFVPKAGTPFQWESQNSRDEILAKEELLRQLLRIKGVKYSFRDPDVSVLEGVFARGDRRLGAVVEVAFRLGARLEAWTERFDNSIWERAFASTGIDPCSYARALEGDVPLYWDHISSGPSKDFLLSERRKAMDAVVTPDCRESGCFDCGACGEDGRSSREMPARPERARPESAGDRDRPAPFGGRTRKPQGQNGGGDRWRIRYAKERELRFLSHLDILRAVTRAVTASGLAVAFSHGFNPHPKISFGPSLPVGTTGEAEIFDIQLVQPSSAEEVRKRLSLGLPVGLRIVLVSRLQSQASASADAVAARYVMSDVVCLEGLKIPEIETRIAALRRTRELEVERRGKKKKMVTPADQIMELNVIEEEPLVLGLVLAMGKKGAMRPADVLDILCDGAENVALARIHRTELLRNRFVNGPGFEGL